MGLLLSILVGCVGAIELLACLKHLTEEITITPAPCLSYHGPAMVDNPSFHDSLCGISHSEDLRMPSSARNKLENFHEYSLRVRSELKSHGFGDGSTLSELSSRDLRSVSRADSRLSLDFELIEKDAEEPWQALVDGTRDQLAVILTKGDFSKSFDYDNEQDDGYDDDHDDRLILEEINDPDKLIGEVESKGILKPIPILPKNLSTSSSSLDLSTTFENDSGNELPTKEHFRHVPVVVTRYNGGSSSSTHSSFEDPVVCRKLKQLKKSCIKNRETESKSPDHSAMPSEITSVRSFKEELSSNESLLSVSNSDHVKSIDGDEDIDRESRNKDRGTSPVSQPNLKRHKVRPTSVLRKSTRLKSENAEISKSAENLSTKNLTKRQRDPERRKSDISIQTNGSKEFYRDEWTNTSPTDSEKSMSTSRSSLVSVEVQTNLEIDDYDIPPWKCCPKSESIRDGWMKNGRRSFVSKRFPKSRSLDDHYTVGYGSIDPDKSMQGVHYVPNNDFQFRGNNSRVEASTADPAPARTSSGDAEATNSWRPSILLGSEEDSLDEEEFVDAEDESILQTTGPIEYCIPSVESSKAFWRQATRRWMRRSLPTDNQQHDHEDEADGDDQDTKTHPDRDGRQITVVGLG
ncbi:hypothetical protein G9C98_003924 [Cotesia typhae]|uniref:MOSC domain-containing protein n=1 Tax=Cotesia typhae TaxID=2053667 RepID=A0A8J5UQX8_9HYME|nr:hypothetical protein G9C98_003924 [Cotesia typhae]